MPDKAARSRAGITVGGWLTIRYLPSTSSPSLDSAWRLSRVCAFSAALRARFRAFFASLVLFFAFFLSAFVPFFAAFARSAMPLRTAVTSWSSSSRAYQMSIVPICAKEAIASR